MPLYNIQKRATLDRLSSAYIYRMRAVMREDAERQALEMIEALRAGRRAFTPDLKAVRPRVSDVFDAHRDKVIHVAVSDGIQEVTPDQRLGLWEAFPPTMPIEITLGVELARKRDKIAEGLKKRAIKKNTYKLGDQVSAQLDAYLKNIQKAYTHIASGWLEEGEGSIEDVTGGLRRALQLTDNEASRIFVTETTNYFNRTRHDYFSENTAVDYMELYAVTDGRISRICEDRHRAVFTLAEAGMKKYMPSFHPHCRTIQRPLISALSTHRRIIDEGLLLRLREPSWTPTAWAS